MERRNPLLRLALAGALLSPLAAQQPLHGPSPAGVLHPVRPGVWVVDTSSGLRPAIEAAAPGDVILLRKAQVVYDTSIAIVGKGLTIIGDDKEERVRITLVHEVGLVVRDVPAGQHVVLRNLLIYGQGMSNAGGPALTTPVLRLIRNDGTVWIEDCLLHANNTQPSYPDGRDGILIRECASVVLNRDSVSLTGSAQGVGRRTIRAIDSSVHAFQCTVTGAYSSPLNGGTATVRGGDAIGLESSLLFASGCTIAGGQGSDAFCGFFVDCVPGKDGGPGLRVDAGSECRLVASTVQGGAGGGPGGALCVSCPGGSPGTPVVQQGMFEDLGGNARAYELRSGDLDRAATLTATGPEGDLVLALVGDAPASLWQPQHLGPQLVDPPFAILTQGVIPSGGVLSLELVLPRVPPPLSFVQTFQQGFFFEPGGEAFLASGSALVTLAR